MYILNICHFIWKLYFKKLNKEKNKNFNAFYLMFKYFSH